jgi:hypothetical protein
VRVSKPLKIVRPQEPDLMGNHWGTAVVSDGTYEVIAWEDEGGFMIAKGILFPQVASCMAASNVMLVALKRIQDAMSRGKGWGVDMTELNEVIQQAEGR